VTPVHFRWALIAGITAVVGIAACSSGSAPRPGSTASPTTTAAAPPQSPTTVADTATTAPGTVQNLPVTAAVRQSLVAAGAASHQLTPADYAGLRAGETYYGYDPSTSTYWAAAALDPSPSSTPAQVASQDDGSYLLFEMPAGGSWTVYDDGLAGVSGTKCPVTVPPALVTAWGWAPGTCAPANRS